MNQTVRIILYVVLVTAATILATRFYHTYQDVNRLEVGRFSEDAEGSDANPAPGVNLTNRAAATNLLTATNAVETARTVTATNLTAESNLVATASDGQTNGTNQAAAGGTNTASSGARAHLSRTKMTAAEPRDVSISGLMTYGVGLFVVVVCLSLLIAHDVSNLVAGRIHEFILMTMGAG